MFSRPFPLPPHTQEEKLEGDNRYFCETCQSKQNATRKIRLLSLPCTLNLQLMRFVFDRWVGTPWKLLGNHLPCSSCFNLRGDRMSEPLRGFSGGFKGGILGCELLLLCPEPKLCLCTDKLATRRSWIPTSASQSCWTWSLSWSKKVSLEQCFVNFAHCVLADLLCKSV